MNSYQKKQSKNQIEKNKKDKLLMEKMIQENMNKVKFLKEMSNRVLTLLSWVMQMVIRRYLLYRW